METFCDWFIFPARSKNDLLAALVGVGMLASLATWVDMVWGSDSDPGVIAVVVVSFLLSAVVWQGC